MVEHFGPRRTYDAERRVTRPASNIDTRPVVQTEHYNVGDTSLARITPTNRIEVVLPLTPFQERYNATIGGGTSRDANRRARRNAQRRT